LGVESRAHAADIIFFEAPRMSVLTHRADQSSSRGLYFILRLRSSPAAPARMMSATFHIGGGARIEAAVAQVGMKYVRLRQGEAGDTVQLPPADRTAEAWRARIGHAHPTASRVVGWISLVVLLAVLGIELPQLVNLAGNLTPLIGLPSFEVPALTLSGWVNLALIFLAGAAGLERSLSMKYNPLLDD
ncbi:hypothetical protein, partial [Ruania albidiflava]|uniref:hypothetical protein n=1 Tax=Ruania albidiflava TaxID=366586 RepID=UPI0023F2A5AD